MATVQEGDAPAKPAGPEVHTYHCLCTQLVLATTTALPSMSRRSRDNSHICNLYVAQASNTAPSTRYASLLNTTTDRKPTMIRLEDGFEKRYLQRCGRCKLVVGYHLDKSQYEDAEKEDGRREDVVYLLPGGLMTTEEMRAGKNMEKEVGAVAVKV